MLATRRWLGYFLAKRSIPDDVNVFVIDQLDTQQLADGVTSVPKQSLSRYRQRIRRYFGAERYADKGRACCESAVLAAALTMSDPHATLGETAGYTRCATGSQATPYRADTHED